MKESYRENLATYSGLKPYAGDGNIAGVATAGVQSGQLSSSETGNVPRADTLVAAGRQYVRSRYVASGRAARRSRRTCA